MMITEVICFWLMLYVLEEYRSYDEFGEFVREIRGKFKKSSGEGGI